MNNNETGQGPMDDGLADSGDILFDPATAVDGGIGEELQAGIDKAKEIHLHEVGKVAKKENHLNDVRQEPNIVERGKKLASGQLVSFPDIKRTADGYIVLNCDKNRFAAFDALFGEDDGRPHIDTFRGRLVDWQGIVVDDQYSMVELLDALHYMGMKLQSSDAIRKSFREWGLRVKTNDLVKRFSESVPVWDGVQRLEEKLINLFGCFDTELNRSFGRYFWLSIYCRITEPGCMAPMVLSLFGAQDVGKSYFSKLICRTLIGDPKSDPVQLDMGANKIDFLRAITGCAIVANIGEMTGFSRTDLNDIKQFITATSDDMHQKFEGHFRQQRQWIAIMDGNQYVGLQRDDTGNRRFYPMFVGQLPDKHGQPDWAEDFKADFTGFESDLWQLMAECRAWLAANGGMEGYNKHVESVSRQVKEFSQSEMNRGRGVVMDHSLDTYLVPALVSLSKLNAEIVDGSKNKGVWITTAAIKSRIKYLGKGAEVKDNHLKARMKTLGATHELLRNVRGYLFRDVMTEKDYLLRIGYTSGESGDDFIKTVEQFRDEGDF